MPTITHISQTKTGDIVHRHAPFVWYKLGRWISWLIRKVTKSWSGHTAMIVWVFGEPMVYESDEGHVRPITYKQWAKDAEIVITRFEMSNRKRRKLAKISTSQLGKEYDFKGTIIDQFILQIRGKWYGYTGDNAEDKMYCSEYIAWCYNKLLKMYADWFKTPPSKMYADNRFKRLYTGKAINLI